MKKSLLWVATAGLVATALVVVAPRSTAQTATVTIVNNSDWDIHRLFLSPTDEDHWGPDQLGDEVLASGGSFKLRAIPCDDYDVKLIDEDGDECVVAAVDICGGHEKWAFDNDDLLDCEWGS